MEDPEPTNPFKRCFKYHWPGVFHFITFVTIFPLSFIPPIKQNAVICVWLIMFLWFVGDVLPTGATALLPIIIFPPMGVMPSDLTCMNYAQNSSSVFVVSCFIAITLEVSKTAERLAFVWVKIFSHRPRVLLISVMVFTWLLSALVPNAVVCSLMIPLTKNIIQVLEAISVGKLINETIEPKPEEPPYPSNLTKGLALGVGFASTIGGMITLTGSEVGVTMYMEYKKAVPNAKGQLTYATYMFVGLPLSILLLIFTIFYLEIVFLGLFRKNSPDNLVFDNEASRDALNAAIKELPPQTIYHYLVIILYIALLCLCIFLQPIFMDGLADLLNERSIKYSAMCMLICFAFFVLPSTYQFLKYFICKAPSEFKTAQSMLIWPAVHKNMLWNFFLGYGSTLTLGESIKRAFWPISISKFAGPSIMLDRLYYLTMASILTIMGADHIVAKHLFGGAARQYLLSGGHPGNAVHALIFGSQLSFLLPVSSVGNCFASGWFNIRTRHVMLAGIGPLIMGFLLSAITILILVPIIQPEFESAPY